MMKQFPRKKESNIPLSIIYRFFKVPLFCGKRTFNFCSTLSWFFYRLAWEKSFLVLGDDSKHPVRETSLLFILERLNMNDNVLDIGCGNGLISKKLAEVVKKIAAVDHNYEQIIFNRRFNSLPNIDYIHGDALKFIEKSSLKFNKIICSHILEHLENPIEFLLNFRDVDEIYIEVPDLDQDVMNSIRDKIGLPCNYNDRDHVFEFTRRDMMSVIFKAGFQLITSDYSFGVMRLWVKPRPKYSH